MPSTNSLLSLFYLPSTIRNALNYLSTLNYIYLKGMLDCGMRVLLFGTGISVPGVGAAKAAKTQSAGGGGAAVGGVGLANPSTLLRLLLTFSDAATLSAWRVGMGEGSGGGGGGGVGGGVGVSITPSTLAPKMMKHIGTSCCLPFNYCCCCCCCCSCYCCCCCAI